MNKISAKCKLCQLENCDNCNPNIFDNKKIHKDCSDEYYLRRRRKYNRKSDKKRILNGKSKECHRVYYNNNIGKKIERNMRSRIYSAVKRGCCSKKASSMELVGCEIDYLLRHIESLFSKGMTWDNYGKWHIDHIIPCCSFNLENEEEQKKCFHYTNLQPLWAIDNLIKGSKITYPIL